MTEVVLMVPPGGVVYYPSLGLGYLAAVLEQRCIPVSIIDCPALGWDLRACIRHLVVMKPKIIGISVFSSATPVVYKLINAIKETLPKSLVVLGGPHFEIWPESAKDYNADYAFHGDCELVFADLCERELGGRRKRRNEELQGLIYRDGDQLKINEKQRVALDAIPFPARHLFPLTKYYSPHDYGSRGFTASIISSRGCLGHCVFCCNLSQEVRYRSPSNVIAELVELKRLGAGYVEFVDEMFVQDHARTYDICRILREQDFGLKWGMQTPIRTLTEELIRTLAISGCVKISVGVESGVERIRRRIGKPITDEKLFTVVALCRKYGISVLAHYIFGHPTETLLEMHETIRFALRLNTNYANFNRCVILPGTRLWQLAVQEGRQKADFWKRYMLGGAALPLYIPEGVTGPQFNWVFRKALIRYYLRPAFFWEKVRSLRNISQLRHLIHLGTVFFRILFRKRGTW